MDCKSIDPLWNLADTLTIHQAAALLAGLEPSAVQFSAEGTASFKNDSHHTNDCEISGVQTAFAALTNSILGGKLKTRTKIKIIHDARPVDDGDTETLVDMLDMMEAGDLNAPRYEQLCGENEAYIHCFYVQDMPNWAGTMIDVDDLRGWIESKGIRTGFFFSRVTADPDYLDPQNLRYAPKLAAAIGAWQAVTDPKGKHPKQAIGKWLRENAATFGLTDDDGKVNETGIDEIAKVANWQPGGGAPRTVY
jgi:hypothetical protein